jgi:hemerythrin
MMIDFADIPSVAFEEMNTVHAEEAELLNRIESLLDANASEEDLSKTLETLFEHTRAHFANEERLMRETGFPPYAMHKAEHDRALNEFQLVMMDWRTKKDNNILREYIGSTVPQWLHQHIATMDTATANFIAMVKGR